MPNSFYLIYSKTHAWANPYFVTSLFYAFQLFVFLFSVNELIRIVVSRERSKSFTWKQHWEDSQVNKTRPQFLEKKDTHVLGK